MSSQFCAPPRASHHAHTPPRPACLRPRHPARGVFSPSGLIFLRRHGNHVAVLLSPPLAAGFPATPSPRSLRSLRLPATDFPSAAPRASAPSAAAIHVPAASPLHWRLHLFLHLRRSHSAAPSPSAAAPAAIHAALNPRPSPGHQPTVSASSASPAVSTWSPTIPDLLQRLLQSA